MRGQLSFEFMLYTAISMAATVGMLALYLKGRAMVANAGTGPILAEFEALVGYNMAGESHFYAFVPPGVCNGSSPGNASGAIERYGGGRAVEISNSVCGAAGRFSEMEVYRAANGSYMVEGASG